MNHSEDNRNHSHSSLHEFDSGKEALEGVEKQETLLAAAADVIRSLQQTEMSVEGLADSDSDEQQLDLYTLLEGLTALRQEVSLQGRTFHELEQKLSQHLEQTKHQLSVTESYMAQTHSHLKDAAYDEGFRDAFHIVVDPLLDTHDQFRRMNDQFQNRLKSRQKWRGFFQNTNELKQVQQSVLLTLKKLDQRLESLQIVPVAKVDGAFDPQEMKAVELESTNAMKPDCVVQIFRQGYRYEDRVLRFAEVKVSSTKE